MVLGAHYIVEGFRVIHLNKENMDKVVMDVKRYDSDGELEHNTVFLPTSTLQ